MQIEQMEGEGSNGCDLAHNHGSEHAASPAENESSANWLCPFGHNQTDSVANPECFPDMHGHARNAA
jgi:hypothetical protein